MRGEDIEGSRGVGDGASKHAVAGEAFALDDGVGDKTPGRLEADETVARRRNPDRASAVTRVGDGCHAGGDGGAGAARGPTRRPVEVPGAAGDAERLGLGERHRAEFGGGRLPEQYEAGRG